MSGTSVAIAAADHPRPARLERASRHIRHLALYVMVEEGGASTFSKAVVLVVSAIMAGFIVWASIMRIDEVAIAFGSVVPSGSVQVVQHLEGGIVHDILVEDRATVEAGQVLVRLDPIQATAELEQARSREGSLLLKIERLRAFVEGREPNFGDAGRKYLGLANDQKDILRANSDRWGSQKKVLLEQISQKNEEILAVRHQQAAVTDQLRLLAEEVEMREGLYKGGNGTKVDFFAVRRQHAAVKSELSRLEGQERTAAKALEELARRIADLENNVRQDALNDLGAATAELAQVQEGVARLQDRVKRLEIVSPVRGFVQNLKAKTIGAVIPAGGVVMEIVPMDDGLLVETKISPRDVGHLRVGQKVIVKVASYDFVRYGSVEGTLRSISATTYVDEKDNTPYYKGLVDMAQPWVGPKAGENEVLPGMTVQADIITGDKTLLQYLLKPIQVSLASAFRER